jgi:peptidoglycan/xylan/chitin deacetylase (PgdA/CDA1 family)
VSPPNHISFLKSVKQRTLGAATRSGLTSLARDSRWRGRRLLILGYHGVSAADEHEWDSGLYMPPDLLRSRFVALRDGGYRVLPLSQALKRLYEGTLPARAVALTFDDGAADFESQGRPLLEEFGYPATVYLTTYYSQNQRPVFNTMLRYVLWKGRASTLDPAGLFEAAQHASLRSGEERESVFMAIMRRCIRDRLSGAEKDAIIATVAKRISVDYETIRARRTLCLMSPDEVAALPRDLIDVQLHTHRHRVPTEREPFIREIVDNRRAIAAMTNGANATHFCYPSGVTHPAFGGWLTEMGVTSATTCFPGIASSRSNPLMLPRLIDTMHLAPVEFEGWLTGASAFLPRRSVRAVAPL